MGNNILLIIDDGTLEEYEEYYFSIHTKAKKKPIQNPYHESINQWFIMNRPKMNALKGKWKDFIRWFVESRGYSSLHINKCEMTFVTYYRTNRRHDVDNSCPKFIIDGLVDGGLVIDDDMKHITSLTLKCGIDSDRPRTEIYITILDD